MTVIAMKDGVAACDSGCWCNGREQSVPFPKLTKAPDGTIVGLTGKVRDSWIMREWVLAGMSEDAPPVFVGEGDEAPFILMMKPDGTCWFAVGNIRFSPQPMPATTGEGYACTFCEGAMEAGLSAPDAVALTIRHHQSAGGEVHVERLSRGIGDAFPGMAAKPKVDLPDGWPPDASRSGTRAQAWAAHWARERKPNVE